MNRRLYINIFWVVIISLSVFYTSSPVKDKYLMLTMAIGAIFIASYYIYYLKKYKDILSDKVNLALISIIGITYVVSVFITRGASFRELYAVFVIISICIIGNELIKNNYKEVLNTIIRLIIYISIVAAIFGLYAYFVKGSIEINGVGTFGIVDIYEKKITVISIMRHPNTYAQLCVFSIVASVIAIFIKEISKIEKVIYISNIFLQGYLILLTSSRTAVLMLIVFIMMYLLIGFSRKHLKNIFIGLTIVILILSIFLVISIFSEKYNIINIINNSVKGDITSGRIRLWMASFEAIKNNLFFGVGIINSIPTINQYLNDSLNTLGTHNGYLSVILANGMLVFLSIMVYIYKVLFNAICRIKNSSRDTRNIISLLVASILMILLANMTESLLFGDMNFTVILLWILLIITKNYRDQLKKDNTR